MAESIFTSQVSQQVRETLDARKKIYQRQSFSSDSDSAYSFSATDAHNWLYRKTSYVKASAYSPGKPVTNAILGTNVYGGFSKPKQGDAETKGAYEQLKYVPEGRLFPRPHITNFKTYTAGDFGTLRKCEINFTVYNFTQLNSLQPFFDLGADLDIEYGWYTGGNLPAGNIGRFQGVVFNFSYAVNENGGWDCQVSGMGPGINILKTSTKIKSGNPTEYSTPDGKSFVVDDIFSDILNQARSAAGSVTDSANSSYKDGIFVVPEFNLVSDTRYRTYVTLERLIKDINKFLRQTNEKFGDLKIVCDGNTTRATMPPLGNTDINDIIPTPFKSPNPLKLFFPSYTVYKGTEYTPQGPIKVYSPPSFSTKEAFESNIDIQTDFQKGNLSQVLLNVGWLSYELDKIQSSPIHPKESQKAYTSMTAFLQKIFDTIFIHSGERWKLAMVPHPTDNMTFQIVDTDYCFLSGSWQQQIYEFTAHGTKSDKNGLKAQASTGICRSVDMKSSIPDSVATSTYLQNKSNAAEVDIRTLGVITAGNSSTYESPMEPPAASEIDFNNADFDLANVLEEYSGKDFTADDFVNDANLTQVEREISDLNKDFNMSKTQIPIDPNTPISETSAPPWPISLNITLDGIEGLQFGNMITCNMLPEVYRKQSNKIIFTITKVEHVIADSDWQTRVETIIRIVPDRSA